LAPRSVLLLIVCCPLLATAAASAQDAGAPAPSPPGGGPGFGPPGGGTRAIVKEHDLDRDGRLNAAERKAARAALAAEKEARRRDGDGGGRPPGPPREPRDPPRPGVAVKVADVVPVSEKVSLYDPSVMRTIFIQFEEPDWEAELEDFSHTDVEVPAEMIVDGKSYRGVGVSFRGASSLFTVGAGYKRSLDVAVDAADPKLRLLGYKTLNLLNLHADPSLLHSALASHITRQYLPAPKVNFVRVVINGESWGVYANAQQFDRIFVQENFRNADGARWKVPGSPRGRGGLEVFADLEEYKRRFELKAGNEKKAWKDLANLCKVLNETPVADLEAKLEPVLDVDGALRFLAVDVVLANGDGYWTRASDYSMFQDAAGRFHLVPHDMNEVLQAGGGFGPGPGSRRAPGPESRPDRDGRPRPGMGPPDGPRPGPTLDPLVGLDDPKKPLRSRLLAVPGLRERYLRYVRDLAENALDWKRLGPVVAQYRALIDREVEIDTRKLSSTEEFRRLTAPEVATEPASEPGRRPRGMSIRAFVEERRRYLLDHPAIRALPESRGTGR
jgi:spore coat protein CotH